MLCGFAAAQCGKPLAYRQAFFLLLLHAEAKPQHEGIKRIRVGKAKPFRSVRRQSREAITSDKHTSFQEAHTLCIAKGLPAFCW